MEAATRYQEQFCRILGLLEENAAMGMSVTTIARELGITRISAAKYLELLAANGDVRMGRFGQKKLYRRSHRLPLLEVIDRFPDALVVLDPDLRVSMVNASFVATLGIQPGRNLVGAPLLDLDLPVFSEPSVRRNIEGIRRSETYLDEMQLVDERTDRVYLVDFAPIVWPAAGPGIMVSFRDVTALRKVETALKDSQRKMALLFGTIPSGIVIFAADGTILNANPVALRILGLRSFEQLSAACIFTVSCAPGTLEALIAKGRAADIELAVDFDLVRREQVPGARSGVAYFDGVVTPIRRDAGGPPDEFAILFKGITADRQSAETSPSKKCRTTRNGEIHHGNV